MLTHSDLRKGVKIILNEEPYEILESRPLKIAQRRVIIQTKIRNLINGNVISKNFHQGETLKEADLSKIEVKFLFSKKERKQGSAKDRILYSHPHGPAKVSSKFRQADGEIRNQYFFSYADDPGKRFSLTPEQVGPQVKFLKPNEIVTGIIFNDRIISISLPIKINLKITEAPPGIKGGRSQPGNKQATIETGNKINVPLFIKEGDIIEVNTETGEYVRRIE